MVKRLLGGFRNGAPRMAWAALVVRTGVLNPAVHGRAVHFGHAIQTLFEGFSESFGVAVDVKGNVYVGDTVNNGLKEILFEGISFSCVKPPDGNSFPVPIGIAPGGRGNLSFSSESINPVNEPDRANPPSNNGGIEFLDGINLSSTDQVNANGQMSLAAATIAPGHHTITAKYTTGTNYVTGSATITITLTT